MIELREHGRSHMWPQHFHAGGPGTRKGLRSPPETVPPLHFHAALRLSSNPKLRLTSR
jgi:hypothetical protein